MLDLKRKLHLDKAKNEAIELSKTFVVKPGTKYISVKMANSMFHPSVDISCSQKTLYQQR